MTIRVLLADDQVLIRAGFRVLIELAPDIVVVAEVSNGADAVAATRQHRADVVLMDIRMPVMDGIAATSKITADEDLAGVRVIMLTTFEDQDLVIRAIKAGASGFLGKGVEPADLVEAIRTVAEGEALLSPRATQSLLEHLMNASMPLPLYEPTEFRYLTGREREIMAMVATGLSNHEIAESLFLSPLTVKTHVNRTMMKLGARDRAQLVVLAYESGMVQPGRDRKP